MAVILDAVTRVNIYPGGEKVTFIFPAMYDPDFDKQVRLLLKNRFEMKGRGQLINKQVETRVKFVEATLLNVEGIEKADGTPIDNTLDGWVKMLPSNWKSSVAGFFEEEDTLTDEDQDLLE